MEKSQYEELYNLESNYWWFVGRRKVAFGLLNKFYNEKRINILDAGCGTGINMSFLKKYGNVIGVDISQEALNFCRKRNHKNVKRSKVEQLPFKDKTFDLVTCFGVLYHKNVNDEQAIKEFYRVLKPGGRILITTPATKFLRHKLFRTSHDELQHTGRRHSKKDLKNLIKNSNLGLEKISYYTTVLFPGVVLSRLLNKKNNMSDLTMPSTFINNFLISIMSFENIIIQKTSLPFGLGLVCLTKPK